MSSVAEHHNLGTGEIKLHHRLLDTELTQAFGGLCNHRRRIVLVQLVQRLAGAENRVLRQLAIAVGAIGAAPMRLELAIVTAQALFDIKGHHFISRGGIAALGAGLQRRARIEMHHAVGAEADAIRCQGQVSVIAAIEILSDNGGEMVLRLAAQCIADIHILSRNA